MSADIDVRRATATVASAALGMAFGARSGTWAKIAAVSLQRVSWLVVVGLCALASVLLAISGYSGYSIVVAAVGLAAAINLF
jgi:hypothetical protein